MLAGVFLGFGYMNRVEDCDMSVNGVGLVSPRSLPGSGWLWDRSESEGEVCCAGATILRPSFGLWNARRSEGEVCLAQVIGDAANNVDIINSFFDANKGPGLCASTSQLGSRSAVSAR